MTPAAFVTEARTWIGTKWVHGQALRHVGTDCIGFIVALGKSAGWIPAEYKPPVYSSQWSLHRDTSILTEELARFCDKLNFDETSEEGDIYQYMFGRTPGHAGIYTASGTIINADIRKRRVAEVPEEELAKYIASRWRPRWTGKLAE